MTETQVLVVEDEIIVADDIRRTLQKLGYAVPSVVSSGEDAIKEVEKNKPDLVLMDIMLKGEMDGIQTAGQINSRFNIPVVYLTAYSDEKILERAKATEPFGYIIKPFKKRELHITIEMALTKHRIEKQLKKSKEFIETVLNSMNDAISVIDVNDFRIIDANTVFLESYGLNKKEMIGKTCHEITHRRREPCNVIGEICPLLETVNTGGHSITEHVHCTKDDKKRYVEVSASPIKDENGKVISVIHVARDITERKRAEEIRLENERLVLANRAKSEFLATMSHELRTPMNAVLGFSEILKQKTAGELNERQEHFIDNILTSGKRQLDLIEKILDLTQMEAGKLELAVGKVAVPEIIGETLEPIKTIAASRKVVIKKELDSELEFIMADRNRFKQVLSNLLDNAVKFSKPDGGTVTVTSKKEGDMAMFSVSDTGIGIKEEDMGKLFRTFQQIDTGAARKYGGTGIGLAITKHLVELHGGAIMVESKYGEGSTFIFSIPLEDKRRRNDK